MEAKSGPLESGDFGDYGDFGKIAKNRQRAGDSIWMPKEARWRVVILPKMANLDGENDEFGPNGKKRPGLVESGDFGENDKKSPEGW